MNLSATIEIKTDEPKNRWVSYFDLLGFTTLVEKKNWLMVLSCLARAIEQCTNRIEGLSSVEATWFSDTFVFYSKDNNGAAFAEIESASRWFMYFLITGNIPVRGAMSCGELYVDKENNVLFGKALIEAHRYGENQDWIGFVLCPSATKRMTELGVPGEERLNYALWPVPRKDTNVPEESLISCVIGEHAKINGENQCLEILKKLLAKPDNPDKAKYENTIRFIESNKRSWRVIEGVSMDSTIIKP